MTANQQMVFSDLDGQQPDIDLLLGTDLLKVADTDGGWRSLYRHRVTGYLWELSYPHSEMHGGGPRNLKQLPLDTADQWQ